MIKIGQKSFLYLVVGECTDNGSILILVWLGIYIPGWGGGQRG